MKHVRQDSDRASGPTFAADIIGWIDFETRSDTDIRAGAYRYATEADAIVIAYAIGDGPISTVSVSAFDGPLRWSDMPEAVQMHHERVKLGQGIWAAWNAGFDRAIWNYATIGFPEMEPHHIIDVMAQASAAGLPPDLAMAAKMSGAVPKVEVGKELIDLFCTAKGLKGVHGTPQTHPLEWFTFCNVYAVGDIAAMRSVFKRTKQLTLAEWREYWAMEVINERGVGIDLAMVGAAAGLAAEDKIRSKRELAELTLGAVGSVDEVAKMTAWLLTRLPEAGRDILVKREEEVDEETGEVSRPAKFALTRKRVERLIAFNVDPIADRVLQIRRYGGSKTPAKFARMQESHLDGILRGQYVFNGAGQTGRASSRGVQVHNLAREPLEHEPELIDAMLRGVDYPTFSTLGDDTPAARKLSLLIRPAFVPQGDNVFVWSDWSQIEARIVPWLCDFMPGARARLQIFRDVDADPSLPDLYTRTASVLSGVPVDEVTKAMRQRGKVAELALGFCGGAGALLAMAAGYGLHLDEAEAKVTVELWRAANPWAVEFSRLIWDAMLAAYRTPGVALPVGRIWLRYERNYLGGSLLARLPSGRVLTYRAMHWQDVAVLDDDDKPTGEKRREMTFARGYGRVKLWPGIFVENLTQATAADCLRGTLVILENEARDWMPTRLQTHDEILVETTAGQANEAAWLLGKIMRRGFNWSEGLPLMSEETIAYAYSKHEGSHGL